MGSTPTAVRLRYGLMRFRVLGYGLRIRDFGLRVLGFTVKVQGSGLWGFRRFRIVELDDEPETHC